LRTPRHGKHALLALVAISAVAFGACKGTGPLRVRELFDRIEPGMSCSEVEAMLGQPIARQPTVAPPRAGEDNAWYLPPPSIPLEAAPWGPGTICVVYDPENRVVGKSLNPQWRESETLPNSTPNQASGNRRHEFELFADNLQFYLCDQAKAPPAPEEYTDEDIQRRLKAAPHIVVVQPVRNMTVPVQLEVCGADPGLDPSDSDHIAECSLDLPSGRLQVLECTGKVVQKIELAPGSFRVRVRFSGLNTLSRDGVDGNDRYRITMWPAAPAAVTVIKQWSGTQSR